jgi:hypothetical protein
MGFAYLTVSIGLRHESNTRFLRTRQLDSSVERSPRFGRGRDFWRVCGFRKISLELGGLGWILVAEAALSVGPSHISSGVNRRLTSAVAQQGGHWHQRPTTFGEGRPPGV